jgi:hypothetical protein
MGESREEAAGGRGGEAGEDDARRWQQLLQRGHGDGRKKGNANGEQIRAKTTSLLCIIPTCCMLYVFLFVFFLWGKGFN